MFRIGVLELALTCGLLLLVLIVPVMITRFYVRVDKRLKNIEKKIDKKK
jgi:flagellar biosynthesis protein FliR